MITLHNAFDGLKAANLDVLGPWWAILHTRDKVQLAADWSIDPYYPLVPWIGVMAVGYGFGKWFSNNQFRSRNHLLALGFTVITAFILLRWTNLYGDPMPWQVYADPAFTVLSFINCHKYPPSLLYLLMTLGPALVILGLLEGQTSLRFAVLQLFGKTPLFFYLIHLYLIHLTALAVAAIKHGPVAVLMRGGIWSPGLPLDYGYDLPVVYIIWLIMLLILYPLCRGFEVLKANKPHWRWLNYL